MNKLDENRYSRQLYVLGRGPMIRFMETKVLLSGLGGLGVEIAKNLILSGIQSLTLHDSKNCSLPDLSSHFILSEKNIGENRAKSCLAFLRQLNPVNVVVDIAHNEELSMPFISNFSIVICTEGYNYGEMNISHLANLCHDNGIYFIMAETRGVFARIFCDFGEKFIVSDPDGKDPEKIPIKSISKALPGVVTCESDDGHDLETGDSVYFGDIKGMIQLNGQTISDIKVLDTHQFTIRDTRGLSDYVSGGYIRKEVKPKILDFESFSSSFENPRYIVPDGAKPQNPLQIHLAFRAFDAFIEGSNRIPNPWDNDDAGLMIQEALTLNKYDKGPSHLEIVNTQLIEAFSYTCAGNLCPMNAFIGGIVAQEAMKAATGKFCPLFQWMFFDIMECIDMDNIPSLNNFHKANARYLGQISVIGTKIQEKINNLKVFVVGSGAIGCELLKNMALMGVGTGVKGKIVVTDMDFVEKSNLCRQLLYRDADIGKPKSVTAAAAVKRINPLVNIEAHENQVRANTENIYDDAFFTELDLITNALDNIPSRNYMDKMCVKYKKPLLESGTSGTKGNSLVVAPFYSKCYRDYGEPKQRAIQLCTLKHFPYQITHTILWARDLFEEHFVQQAKVACNYVNGRRIWEEDCGIPYHNKFSMLSSLKNFLVDNRPCEFLECVRWARDKFEKLFVNDIKQLLHNFPENHKVKDGCLFWSGSKRCPKPIYFDINDDLCFEFIYTASNLLAEVFGIIKVPYRDAVYILLRKVEDTKNEQNLQFTPEDSLKMDIDAYGEEMSVDEYEGGANEDTEHVKVLEDLMASLPLPTEFRDIKIKPLNFEKDGDTLHIEFVTAASNLRARCYSIDPVDALKTKQIAGKIIPAISTTTSVVAGLVCLEIYKLLLDKRVRNERFRDCYFDLAAPLISVTKTSPADQITCSNGFTWDLWYQFEVYEKDCPTLKAILNHFKDEELDISVLSCGKYLIYYNWMSEEIKNDLLDETFKEVIVRMTKKPLEPKAKTLTLNIRCSNLLESDVLPPVTYFLLQAD